MSRYLESLASFGSAASHGMWLCRFASPDYSGFALSGRSLRLRTGFQEQPEGARVISSCLFGCLLTRLIPISGSRHDKKARIFPRDAIAVA